MLELLYISHGISSEKVELFFPPTMVFQLGCWISFVNQVIFQLEGRIVFSVKVFQIKSGNSYFGRDIYKFKVRTLLSVMNFVACFLELSHQPCDFFKLAQLNVYISAKVCSNRKLDPCCQSRHFHLWSWKSSSGKSSSGKVQYFRLEVRTLLQCQLRYFQIWSLNSSVKVIKGAPSSAKWLTWKVFVMF